MQIKFSDQRIHYDGTQLSPHWIYKTFGIVGDALVAFRGKADIKLDRMVDLADVKEGRPIAGDEMLHFLGEFFDCDLTRTILLERLLVSLAQQEIIFRTKNPGIVRGGNDLYEGVAKLSVAIATASPVSTLIHFGINVVSTGTPVKTRGLIDYKIDPDTFARSLLETFRDEVQTVREDRSKVRGVF